MLYAGSMGFAILRTQKLKSTVAVRRSMKHAFREQETPNADRERSPDNTHLGAQSAQEGLDKVAALLPEKRRSDAVLCIEYLVTASPEAMAGKSREEQDAYLHDALDWIRERHGAGNVVYAGIHRDETTPHLYAYAVPLDPDTGRLNAKRWLGGARALSVMQTEFAERVGKRHGLERGIEGSKATHQRVRRHYTAINRAQAHEPVRITAQDLEPQGRKGLFSRGGETPEAVAERITESVRRAYSPTVAEAAEAREMAEKARQAQETARELQRRTQPVLDAFNGLSKEGQRRLLEAIEAGSRQLRKQEAAERRKNAPERTQKRSQTRDHGGGMER